MFVEYYRVFKHVLVVLPRVITEVLHRFFSHYQQLSIKFIILASHKYP